MGHKYKELCMNCDNWAYEGCPTCDVPVCDDCFDDHMYEHEDEEDDHGC